MSSSPDAPDAPAHAAAGGAPAPERLQVDLLQRSFLIALLLGTVAFLAGVLLEGPSGQLNPFDVWAYPAMGLAMFLSALLLILRRRLLQPLIVAMFLAMSGFLLAKFAYLLFLAPAGVDVQAELTETFFWTPVIYLLAYLAPLSLLGRVGALVFNGAILTMSVAHAVPNVLADRNWDTVYALLQLNLASTVLLALTFAFVRARVDYATTKLKAETAEHLAYTDLLTGLPNRLYLQRLLDPSLERARTSGRRLSLLFLDIDGFKVINDTLGHAAGDALLKAFGERLRRHTRAGDLVARVTGDEFVVTAPELEQEGSPEAVAHKLKEVLSTPYRVMGQQLSVTVSIGISVFPDDADDGPSLVRHADSAMGRVKRSGKNGVEFYRGTVDAPSERRRDLEKDLRETYRDRLVLLYQPIYDLRSGEMIKLEALLRWNHPTLDTVAPSDFIPIAEESGLIVPIGRWVLNEACMQLWALRAAGFPDVKVSVNVSPLQFIQSDFVETVTRALEVSGLPADCLELELTESLLMHDLETVTQTLSRLRALGIGLALDDFGTGYSSLSYLRDLPISAVKIDRSFVRDLGAAGSNHFAHALVQSAIRLAASLDLEVVAEGVEGQEQSDILKAMGCHFGQGYYFAKPMPLSSLFHLNADTRRTKRTGDGLGAN